MRKFGIASPGQDANGITFSKEPMKSSFLYSCDEDLNASFPMSTKTRAVREIVRRWQSEAPDDKIIIFTQFTLCAKILGQMLKAEGIQFLYYNGQLDGAERRKAVKRFERNNEIKVMVSKPEKKRLYNS